MLDLAAGTGSSSLPFAAAGAFVVPCDFSLGMLQVGKRGTGPQLPFVAGDALRLPFADASFDAVTISFGLRNVSDIDAALAEMARVTRPGGRLVVCEFSHPTWRAVPHRLQRLPDAGAAPGRPAGSSATRTPTSIWPSRSGPGRTRPALAGRIGAAGWADVAWSDLTYGIVALHRAPRR